MPSSFRRAEQRLATPMSRRAFLGTVGVAGLAAAAAACTSSPEPGPTPLSSIPPNPTLDQLQRGAAQLSVLAPNTPVNPGEQLFGFAITNAQGQLITGGSPEVWVSAAQGGTADGPSSSTWYPFTGYEKTGDRSPKSDLPGVYYAEVDIPSEGTWVVAVRGTIGSQPAVGVAGVPATTGKIEAALGTKAVSTPTPVATTDAKIAEICTRAPVCHMHSISLDEALANGRPTVVSFATPLLCQSRLCGPVVDEQILVFERFGEAKANFIHVEEFLPGPDLKPPSATLENQSPAFKAWRFRDEPWVIVIDGKGVIRGRLGPGPVAAPVIKQVLQPLL